MLNKSQWLSVWVFSTIISILIALAVLNNLINDTDNTFISIVYAFIPIVIIIGTKYTFYLSGNKPIRILPTIRILKNLISKLFFLMVIVFSAGSAIKLPLNIGIVIYKHLTFNENMYKSKFAIERTRGEIWGRNNLEISNTWVETVNNDKKPRMLFKGTVYNKSKIPLECTYLRIIARDKLKNDTLYDSIVGINSIYEPKKKTDVVGVMTEDFFNLFLKQYPWLKDDLIVEYSPNLNNIVEKNLERMLIDILPYGGKISDEYINIINKSNLEAVLE